MANYNCLKGFVCPQCGSEGPFFIVASAEFEVHDDGTSDIITGIEWNNNSPIRCPCGQEGIVGDFHHIKRKEVSENG